MERVVMNQRDKNIVSDIERFRVLSRDLITDLHFGGLKNPVTAANYVLKRLRRDGYITCSQETRQYLYFPAEGHIKKNGAKVNHFLEIGKFYSELCKVDNPRTFIVEPKYGPSMMEPDVFMIFRNAPVFVEIQRTKYSDKQMKEKLTRYEHYFLSNQWHNEPWQPQAKKILPHIWILDLNGHKYNIPSTSYRVFQNTIEEMAELTRKK
jgi:hypothetical protein